MIRTAYLVSFSPTPGPMIAGLPVLLRQALSLQDAGVQELVLVGVADRSPLADDRLRLPVRDRDVASIDSTAPALVAAVGCVWPQALVRRLIDLRVRDDEIQIVGEGAAAVYVCGTTRVHTAISLVLSLSKDELVARQVHPERARPSTSSGRASRRAHHERTGNGQAAPLGPREFVMLPRSPRDVDAAVAKLLQSLYKPTDGLVARYLDRRVSLAVTRRLLSTAITPNQMTFAATLVGLIGVVILSRGGYWNVLVGAGLFEAQGILDGCDGEIARMKHLQSRAGEWFDQVADDVLNIALLVSVGVVLAREGYSYAIPLTRIAFVSQIVYAVALYAGLLKTGGGGSVARLRWWVDGPRDSAGSARSGDRFWRFVVGAFGDFTRRDFIAFFYLLSALAGWLHAAFLWQTAVTIGSGVATSVQWLVWGGPEAVAGPPRPRDA